MHRRWDAEGKQLKSKRARIAGGGILKRDGREHGGRTGRSAVQGRKTFLSRQQIDVAGVAQSVATRRPTKGPSPIRIDIVFYSQKVKLREEVWKVWFVGCLWHTPV
jgi:hypothetical protein